MSLLYNFMDKNGTKYEKVNALAYGGGGGGCFMYDGIPTSNIVKMLERVLYRIGRVNVSCASSLPIQRVLWPGGGGGGGEGNLDKNPPPPPQKKKCSRTPMSRWE